MDISLEKVKAKSAIIYGLGENGRKAYCYLNRRYNIIGCSDTNIEQKNGKLAKLVPFIMPSDIKNYQVDYILVTSIYGEEILEYLTKDMGVDARKIMLRDAWCSIPFQTSLGEENPDKTYYVERDTDKEWIIIFSIFCIRAAGSSRKKWMDSGS